MTIKRNAARTIATSAMLFGLVSLTHAQVPVQVQAQAKTQPVAPQVPGGVNQTPWFANPQVRQHLKFNDEQFTGMSKAYQDAWGAYQRNIIGLDKTLTPAERQKQLIELQQGFQKNFANAPERFITNPAQLQRYNELGLQYRSFGAFTDPTIGARLKLTPEQTGKLTQFQQDWTIQMSKLDPTYQTNREQAIQQFTKMQTQNAELINSILTLEQQAMWREMAGTPYSFGPDIYLRGTTPSAVPGTQK